MKRRPRLLLVVLLCLLAGAIVNVAVAWGFAYTFEIDAESDAMVEESPPQSRSRLAAAGVVKVRATLGTLVLVSFDDGYYGGWRPVPNLEEVVPAWGHTHLSDETLRAAALRTHIVIHGIGWPARTFSGAMTISRATGGRGSIVGTDSSYVISSTSPALARSRLLPMQPIWPGFAINTVFYAFIVWLLVIVPFALRRRRRIKRGLCPKCAYPTGVSDACTECGTLLSSATPSPPAPLPRG